MRTHTCRGGSGWGQRPPAPPGPCSPAGHARASPLGVHEDVRGSDRDALLRALGNAHVVLTQHHLVGQRGAARGDTALRGCHAVWYRGCPGGWGLQPSCTHPHSLHSCVPTLHPPCTHHPLAQPITPLPVLGESWTSCVHPPCTPPAPLPCTHPAPPAPILHPAPLLCTHPPTLHPTSPPCAHPCILHHPYPTQHPPAPYTHSVHPSCTMQPTCTHPAPPTPPVHPPHPHPAPRSRDAVRGRHHPAGCDEGAPAGVAEGAVALVLQRDLQRGTRGGKGPCHPLGVPAASPSPSPCRSPARASCRAPHPPRSPPVTAVLLAAPRPGSLRNRVSVTPGCRDPQIGDAGGGWGQLTASHQQQGDKERQHRDPSSARAHGSTASLKSPPLSGHSLPQGHPWEGAAGTQLGAARGRGVPLRGGGVLGPLPAVTLWGAPHRHG